MTTRRQHRLTAGYPVLAEIMIDPTNWFRFNNLVGDTPATRIIGHEGPQDGWLTVLVANPNQPPQFFRKADLTGSD
jgi:hypothetical protein